jgi:hypothetical protein
MKRFTYLIIAVLLLAACSPVSKDCVAVCGGREVRIIDWSASEGKDVKVLWEWHLDDPEVVLPTGYEKYMHHPDDCKFVDGNSKLLVTASGNGMMLLDIKTKKILHYAYVPMAHSADLLPGNRIAVALSTHKEGNALELYDADIPEKCIYRDSLYSGHGVVCNEKRQSLYALGYRELREYKLENWNSAKPSLRMVASWEIPLDSGHDLSPVDNDRMLVTAGKGVHMFHIPTGEFTPFEPLKDAAHVKSVNYDPQTSRLIYTKGEISWWTHNIYQQNPEKVVTIDSMNVYKVRPAR